MSARVVIGYCKGQHVDGWFHDCAMRLVIEDRGRQIAGTLSVTSGPTVAPARDEIVARFLGETGAPWLFMVDTDMAFLPDLVSRLVDSAHPTERPIVGGLCFVADRAGNQRPTIYHATDHGLVAMFDYPRRSLVEVDATGAACLLVHRRVLEAMGEPWFDLEHNDPLYDLGEDMRFCLRAKDLGFPIFVDTRIGVGHVKPQRMDEATYFAQRLPREKVVV